MLVWLKVDSNSFLPEERGPASAERVATQMRLTRCADGRDPRARPSSRRSARAVHRRRRHLSGLLLTPVAPRSGAARAARTHRADLSLLAFSAPEFLILGTARTTLLSRPLAGQAWTSAASASTSMDSRAARAPGGVLRGRVALDRAALMPL
jgi:hypothetical protein